MEVPKQGVGMVYGLVLVESSVFEDEFEESAYLCIGRFVAPRPPVVELHANVRRTLIKAIILFYLSAALMRHLWRLPGVVVLFVSMGHWLGLRHRNGQI